jgi:large conductance mechanosensitive channel
MSILSDFRAFAMKGNVVDMAVGVVIGTAFGKIVSSLVADIITPVLGLLIGGLDFKDMKLVLREKVDKVPEVTWNYGVFLQAVFDFLIISIAIFSLVRLVSMMQRRKPEAPPAPAAPPAEVVLLTEIRDALRAKA